MGDISPVIDELRNLHLAEKSAVQLNNFDPDYILDLCVQNRVSEPLIAAACSNFTIRLMSRSRLTPVSTLTGHKTTITKVQFGKTDPDLVFSCSKDKTVRCWDTRKSTSKEVQKFETPPSIQSDVLSLDISDSDRLLCAGTEMISNDAYLLFWDRRQGPLLGCYSECHQDDINQVCFQPGSDQYLASGSADGLVCTFDLSETSEDDALQLTCNAESDVARVGWCGENCTECIYCVTSDRTTHVWDATEGESLSSVTDLDRSDEKKKPPTDYVVDCIPELTACPDRSTAVLLTGSHSGDLALVSSREGDSRTLVSLSGGHTATVRCCHWDAQTKTLLTGGEDSLVCLWSMEPTSHSSPQYKGKIKGKTSITPGAKKPYSKRKK